MTYCDDLAVQFRDPRLQLNDLPDAIGATNCVATITQIEMNIGDWYLDEFGNQCREITARDVEEKLPLRNRRMRTAARLIQLLTI